MKILLYLFFFFRSALLRGLINTIRLLRAEYRYEKQFRIRTSRIKHSDSDDFYHYQGAPYWSLMKIFATVPQTCRLLPFIDIGSGKGRAVFVAEYCGFHVATGVELQHELVEESQANLRRYPYKRKASSISFIQSNALDFAYPEHAALYFFFNPFSEEIMERVLEKMVKVGKEEIWFVYMNPMYPGPFDRKGLIKMSTVMTRFYTEATVYRYSAE